MPSRTMTLAIAVFWLATIGWMVYRDQNPEQELPPKFWFDLTDEVGPPKTVLWKVFFARNGAHEVAQDQPIAVCNTALSREPRRFKLNCTYVFVGEKHLDFDGVPVRLIENTYQVTLRGELVGLQARVAEHVDGSKPLFNAEIQADYWGTNPSWNLLDQGREKPLLAKVSSLRAAFNPLLPRFTFPGLYTGRTWRSTVIDPLENARKRPDAAPAVLTAQWQAQVGKEKFIWNEWITRYPKKQKGFPGGGKTRKREKNQEDHIELETEVDPCWRVVFTDADGALRMRIWVRPEDHWVLQQEVYYRDGTLKLVRQSDRKR